MGLSYHRRQKVQVSSNGGGRGLYYYRPTRPTARIGSSHGKKYQTIKTRGRRRARGSEKGLKGIRGTRVQGRCLKRLREAYKDAGECQGEIYEGAGASLVGDRET